MSIIPITYNRHSLLLLGCAIEFLPKIFDPASKAGLKKVESRTVVKKKVLSSEISPLCGRDQPRSDWEGRVAPNFVVFNNF